MNGDELLEKWIESHDGSFHRFDDGEWHYIETGWGAFKPFQKWLDENGFIIVSTKGRDDDE